MTASRIPAPRRASALLLVIIYLGFISLGLPDGTLGVAWPTMHESLGLPIGMAGTLILVVTVLSGISSLFSSRIITRFGTGPVVFVSGLATGSALLIISHGQNLWWLLVAAAPLGFGAGAVDTALNGYVARHYSGRHMNWLHACWGIGATTGPFIMAYAAASSVSWRGGYVAIGAVQLTLAALFLCTLRLWRIVPERDEDPASPHLVNPPVLGLRSRAAWISGIIYFLYVAAEGTLGLWAGSILVEGRGIGVREAGYCVTAYYGSITVGRILTGFVVDRAGNRRLIRAGLILSVVGILLFVFGPTLAWMAGGMVLAGFGFSPVYPGLIHEVPRRFAPEAVQSVIGRQISGAYLGMATFPALAGILAQYSLQSIAYALLALVVMLLAAVSWLDALTPPVRSGPA